jgi:hypothetical protein
MALGMRSSFSELRAAVAPEIAARAAPRVARRPRRTDAPSGSARERSRRPAAGASRSTMPAPSWPSLRLLLVLGRNIFARGAACFCGSSVEREAFRSTCQCSVRKEGVPCNSAQFCTSKLGLLYVYARHCFRRLVVASQGSVSSVCICSKGRRSSARRSPLKARLHEAR